MVSEHWTLDSDELPPFETLNADSDVPCLLLGEHAGNAVPKMLDNLGLTTDKFENHYAVDIGIRGVLTTLAERINACAVLANYSRLVVDVNRAPDHPTAFPRMGEETPVPGNIRISQEAKDARLKNLYHPFHKHVAGALERIKRLSMVPLVISVHSFTPVFFNQQRPWEIGFLSVDDRRATDMIMPYFRDKGFNVGDNQPYDARMLRGTSLNRHACDNRYPSLLFEIRNDLIDTADKSVQWGHMIADALEGILGDKSLHTLYEGPFSEFDEEQSKNYFIEVEKQAKRGEQHG